MIPIVFYTIQFFRDFLKKHFGQVAIALFCLIIFGTIAVYYLEHDIEGTDVNTLFDGFWFVIMMITTVGYGDIAIHTFWTRILAMVLMFAGIGMLGFFTAGIAAEFIEYASKKRYGEREVKLKNHIVLCNWNPIAEEIVHEVVEENFDIVLLALLNTSPRDNLEFVKGTSLHITDLQKVNINEAKSAIVLPETMEEGNLASAIDAKSIISIMNIKKLNPSLHVVVELLKSDSVENAKLAGADEILVRGDIIAKLLAKSVIDPGTIDVMEMILTAKSGEEIFEDEVPSWIVGKKYEDLIKLMLDKNANLIALRNEKGITMNPPKEYIIGRESAIYIARERIMF